MYGDSVVAKAIKGLFLPEHEVAPVQDYPMSMHYYYDPIWGTQGTVHKPGMKGGRLHQPNNYPILPAQSNTYWRDNVMNDELFWVSYNQRKGSAQQAYPNVMQLTDDSFPRNYTNTTITDIGTGRVMNTDDPYNVFPAGKYRPI